MGEERSEERKKLLNLFQDLEAERKRSYERLLSKERELLKKERHLRTSDDNQKLEEFKESTFDETKKWCKYDWHEIGLFKKRRKQDREILNALDGFETCIAILNKLKKQGKLLRPTNEMLNKIKLSNSENREKLLNLLFDEEYFIRKNLETVYQRQRELGREREQLERSRKNIQLYYYNERLKLESQCRQRPCEQCQLKFLRLEQLERSSQRLQLYLEIRRQLYERKSKQVLSQLKLQLKCELQFKCYLQRFQRL
jgi:hypothetical protein